MILFERLIVSRLNRALSIAAVSEISTFCVTEVISACPCKLENFASSAVCVKVLIGLSTSLVLSTFPKPTLEALIPVAIFASVTALFASLAVVIAALATSGKAAVPDKSPANFTTPFVLASASATVLFELFELLLPPLATIDEST